MANYIRALEPIVTPTQMERTKSIIKQFTAPNSLGPKLHQYLVEKREAEDNWAYYYWLNDMYMDIRIPLPINSNPGMVLPPQHFKTVQDVAKFAAGILSGIMQHKEMLDSGNLQQERATSREKNQPLCMAQYYRLLGSCRRPGVERDSQFLPLSHTEDQHVIVFCRNQMYCVVLDAHDRGTLAEKEIASQILHVLSDAPCLAPAPPIGLLTAEPRARWAQDRATLQLSDRNQRNLELIETALIVLCLDEPLSIDFNARGFAGATPSVHRAGVRDETNMAHEMIHGGGSQFNSGNRWFDKTMQIIICSDGTWGLCYEHSTSEGIAVVQLLEKIYGHIIEQSHEDADDVKQQHLPPPERLEWDIVQDINKRFTQAAKAVDKAIDDLDFHVYRYKGYGKNFIKSCQVSPDAYIQLSLQLAHFKLYGRLVATYESASTRRFLHGRVDCIRSASTEALEWAKAMCQGEGANVPLESDREDEEDVRKVKFSIYDRDHLRALFRTAVARQTEVMVQNILGHGIDIPLLGLREASREVNGKLHELFTDESYQIANCFLLSTSQVACSTDSFMGYGPVTPRGYGCSYNPHPNEIVFCVSAFLACGETSASRYAKSLQESLDIMRDLLEN